MYVCMYVFSWPYGPIHRPARVKQGFSVLLWPCPQRIGQRIAAVYRLIRRQVQARPGNRQTKVFKLEFNILISVKSKSMKYVYIYTYISAP